MRQQKQGENLIYEDPRHGPDRTVSILKNVYYLIFFSAKNEKLPLCFTGEKVGAVRIFRQIFGCEKLIN